VYGPFAAGPDPAGQVFVVAGECPGRDREPGGDLFTGPIATDMFLEGKDEELLARLANAAPLQRLGNPSNIAPVVAFLASPEGHWINGQTIRINGGVN
jgi:3-oxoacyl-[acyl-carrier protein] reductase